MAEAKAIDSSKILLVEGDADRNLFTQLCKSLPYSPEIRVASPRDLNPKSRDGKQAVLKQTSILLKQFADLETGSQRCLAVVIDADYKAEGGLGYQKTVEQFESIVAELGYLPVSDLSNNPGLIFQHSDGLSDLGLWVMPNNDSDGMLEDWIKDCIHQDEKPLFTHAESIVEALNPKRFKPIHLSKAEVATWLAWQEQPGHGLYLTVTGQLLDANKPLYSDLIAWLKHIFEKV
ncbi:MAG: hypothetical protein NTV43_09185 [Methylococcales bacterium]|nr:hypothetical protein [Methylococcales bacterium]